MKSNENFIYVPNLKKCTKISIKKSTKKKAPETQLNIYKNIKKSTITGKSLRSG